MRFQKSYLTISILAVTSLFICSCLTSKKMDAYIATQYNNQIPKLDKKKTAEIAITSAVASPVSNISSTVQKTSKFLPLIVYWSYDYRHTSTLNPEIPVNIFSNTVNLMANKGLSQKLNGKKLQLTVEQIPNVFALVDKSHMIFLIYTISWDKIYMEPDFKDMIVSYQLSENDNMIKTGRITIKNNARNKGLRYFQSWKSALSEYLAGYNLNITAMSKDFLTQLAEEL